MLILAGPNQRIRHSPWLLDVDHSNRQRHGIRQTCNSPRHRNSNRDPVALRLLPGVLSSALTGHHRNAPPVRSMRNPLRCPWRDHGLLKLASALARHPGRNFTGRSDGHVWFRQSNRHHRAYCSVTLTSPYLAEPLLLRQVAQPFRLVPGYPIHRAIFCSMGGRPSKFDPRANGCCPSASGSFKLIAGS